jgi:signal transduction histidine kinase
LAQSDVRGDAPPLDEFMSVVAHDLRNPVAVVRASAQMALRQIGRGDLDAAARRVETVVQQTDRMTELVEVFLEAARIASGRLVLRLERVALGDIIQAAGDRARAHVGEYGARAIEVRGSVESVGMWDQQRLVRAVRALIENALLYGDRSQPVVVEVKQGPECVHVSVTGAGRGPEASEARRLFQRFYRGRAAAEAGHAGTGLGLYTARGIARAHGGDIRQGLDGVPNDVFELQLPLEVPDTPTDP